MDGLQTILYTGVAFNLVLVLLIIYLVKRSRANARDQALIRSRQILDQGKIIIAQERVIKSKQEIINEKNELINEYRKTE
jgi:hypothetical protein